MTSIQFTARPLQGALLLAGALLTSHCHAASGVGVASARVLPSTLTASVALYLRTGCGANCGAAPQGPASWQTALRPAMVSMSLDGVAQFTLFGETASNYVVRFSAPDGAGAPILLEPMLTPRGGVSIVVALAPGSTDTDAFQVVINYN